MPQVWDLSADEAERVLSSLGLSFEVERVTSTAVPEGDIVSVAPPPGTLLEADSRIILAVSSGPPIAAPDSP